MTMSVRHLRPTVTITGTIVTMMMMAFLVYGGETERSESAPTGNSVRVAGIVLKWIAGDRAANYERAERLIREAAGNGAKIVATPESFLDGYAIRDPSINMEQFRSLAETIPDGAYCKRLRSLADELDIYLIAAVSELDGEKVYNSAILIDPDGKLIGTYRKKFLWFDEKEKYSAGDALPAFETQYGKVGIMICSDRRQRAAIEELVDNGAELVFCPAGGGYGTENDRVVRQRSQEGKVPIVFVHPIEFLVTGPDGSILAKYLDGQSLDDVSGVDAGVVRYYDLPLDPPRR
jgi:predicted amidohydrolase